MHKSSFSLAAITLHFCRLSLGSDGRRGISDSNFFYSMRCNYVRTPQTVVRKRKLQASTYKETLNGLIWGHLDERMELLGHSLKAIVQLGINLAEFDRTKLDHIQKETVLAKEQQTYRKYFPDSEKVPVCSFWKEPTSKERRVQRLSTSILRPICRSRHMLFECNI